MKPIYIHHHGDWYEFFFDQAGRLSGIYCAKSNSASRTVLLGIDDLDPHLRSKFENELIERRNGNKSKP